MRSSHQKDKSSNRSSSRRNRNDGTSARTRPLSFDEIMLRRKSKEDARETKNNFVGTDNVSDRYHYEESLLGASRHTTEESRKLEENMMAENLARGKNKESRESKIKSKASMNRDVSNKRLSDSSKTDTGLVLRRKDEEFIHESGKRHSSDLARKERLADKTDGKHGEIRKDKKPDKDERQSHKKRKDMEMASDAPLSEADKRHSRNYERRDSHADKTKEKPESGRRKHRSDDEERSKDKNADRKHSSSKVSEVTVRLESSRVHLDEERPKRRRSRSREHDKDRGHKHSTHDLRERGELLSHSSKDKSAKSHYDLDIKISSNGSVSHSSRQTVSTSGLGGYSPRKRKSESAAKTPPPTNRSPDRKKAGWDLPPASAGSNLTGSAASSVQSSIQSVIPNTQQLSSLVPASSFTKMAAGVPYSYLSSLHAIDSVQLTQATRPMRRLYVENLPNSASEKDVLDWINSCLLSYGINRIQGRQPCISCMIHREKGQALLEFLTPEDASAALSFDGSSFSDSILKIRRPKDFVEVATGVPHKSVVSADRIDDTVKDSPFKIFVGGISRTISSDMIMEIAKAFGPLKAYHFRMNSDLDEPCAFLEYVDHSVTLKACAGLNGMKLGGKVLTVVQAVPATALLDKDESAPLYRIPPHAKPLLDKPTEVLKLKNVVDADVFNFLPEADLEELLEDVRLECARFGTVLSINVVKQSQCSVGSDTADMDTGSMMNDDNSGYAKQCDNNDHELEAGQRRLLFRDEGPTVTNSAEEAKRCADGNTQTSQPSKGDSKNHTSDPLPDDGNGISCLENSEVNSPVGFLDEKDTAMVSEREDRNADSSPVEHLEINNESQVKEAMKSEEGDGKLFVASEPETSSKKELDTPEKVEEKKGISTNEEVLEPGCVLVEFRRVEAACMAAHCLHGRLFDDRIVTVEYVALGLYQTKFPKHS